jgi:hypothetical protein
MSRLSKIALGLAVGTALAGPLAANAETATATGAGTITAGARQDFRVIIPRFISFRVGVAGAGFSLVDCDMSANAGVLGDGTDQACAGGDAGSGVSNVSVRSNAGAIGITATTLGALSNGADTLPFSEILTASSDVANFPAPALPANGGTSASVAVAVTAGAITNRSATWTYTYNNSAVYAPGTYGGVNTNNGRVTYTASSP